MHVMGIRTEACSRAAKVPGQAGRHVVGRNGLDLGGLGSRQARSLPGPNYDR